MAKRIPLYPRKEYAKKMAKEFIIKSKAKSLPINPFAICKQHGYVIRSVSETEDLIGEIDPFEVRTNPECDAKTYLTSDGRYVIVYDDSVLSQGRIIWTITHEIAHIVLKHLIQFEQTEIHKGLSKKENEVLEKEADAFASEFLSPAEVLISCKCTKKKALVKLCGLSKEAAIYREEALRNYDHNENYKDLNREIYKQFYNFINNKEFYINVHYNICPVCKNYILSKSEKYCRICGTEISSSPLTKGIIYNDGLEITKQKHTILCPNCLEEQNTKSTTSCTFCGTSLINKCSNPSCNKKHVSTSRYCYECGSPNSFLIDNRLMEWQGAYETIKMHNAITQILENDKDTGKILDDWQYVLKHIKDQDDFKAYNALKSSIAKIDYDTLFIYSNSDVVREMIKDPGFEEYIISLTSKSLHISVMEVLILEIDENGSVSFVA